MHTKTKVSSACGYPRRATTGKPADFGADPYTKVQIKADRSSYCAREARTLFNSSLHYPLFLREVKKPTPSKQKTTVQVTLQTQALAWGSSERKV